MQIGALLNVMSLRGIVRMAVRFAVAASSLSRSCTILPSAASPQWTT